MSTFDNLTGVVIDGKYQIGQRLGTGGMGAVFMATHLGTERLVALKLITPRFASDATFIERFRREARAAGRLRHPNIVDVTDFGFAEVAGEPLAYLVMEYLDGCSLADVLHEDRQLPLEWVVDFFDQLALAVDAAHRHGIVHRDLKPSNVWLEPNQRGAFTVKVLDFGLAKLGDPSAAPTPHPPELMSSAVSTVGTRPLTPAPFVRGQQPLPADGSEDPTLAMTAPAPRAAAAAAAETAVLPPEAELTVVGTVMGTPPYMSPEQCRGEAAGAASDIYSLGVLVYEMLAGATPFEGDTNTLLRKHTTEEPEPLFRRATGIRRRVSDVVMSALAKDPAARPATPVRFAAALRAMAESSRGLLGRAIVLATAHYPLFLRISFVASLPYFLVNAVDVTNAVLARTGVASAFASDLLDFPLLLLSILTGFLASVVSKGVTTLMLAQLLLAPLRRPRARLAASVFLRHLGRIAGGAFLVSALVVVPLILGGFALGLAVFFAGTAFDVDIRFGGMALGYQADSTSAIGTTESIAIGAAAAVAAVVLLWLALRNWISYQLFPIVLLVESRRVREGLTRSRRLSLRARREVVAVAFASLAPMVAASLLSATLYHLLSLTANTAGAKVVDLLGSAPIMILTDPFVSVLAGLLYLKLRQTDGESIEDVLDCQFVDEEQPRSRWQQRLSSGALLATPSARSGGSGDQNQGA